MRKIVDIHGEEKQVECLSCAIAKGEIARQDGSIATTDYFNAHQDFEIPIPGFVILASRRHVKSIDDFTEEEKIDFINFLVKIRRSMRKVLGTQTVYLVQEEDTPDHFHIWLFPRYEWMDRIGKKVQSIRPIMEYAREKLKTLENLEKVTDAKNRLKSYLKNYKF